MNDVLLRRFYDGIVDEQCCEEHASGEGGDGSRVGVGFVWCASRTTASTHWSDQKCRAAQRVGDEGKRPGLT